MNSRSTLEGHVQEWKGKLFKTWTEIFLVLQKSDLDTGNCLYTFTSSLEHRYYSKENRIPLKGAFIYRCEVDKTKFQVWAAGEARYFSTATELECEEWMVALQAARSTVDFSFPPHILSKPIIKEGWLLKEAGMVAKTFQIRYCILQYGCLVYAQKNESLELTIRDTIDLQHSEVMLCSDSVNELGEKATTFRIAQRQKQGDIPHMRVFQAASNSEALEWVNMIEMVHNFVREIPCAYVGRVHPDGLVTTLGLLVLGSWKHQFSSFLKIVQPLVTCNMNSVAPKLKIPDKIYQVTNDGFQRHHLLLQEESSTHHQQSSQILVCTTSMEGTDTAFVSKFFSLFQTNTMKILAVSNSSEITGPLSLTSNDEKGKTEVTTESMQFGDCLKVGDVEICRLLHQLMAQVSANGESFDEPSDKELVSVEMS
eukprot:Lithocolla_globosa_v1_NODE_3188_length_1737_cov_44.897741.p1 type:complete len:425 gc:universal NODE_3188_length_1737_cov_44.897741:1397-123(-)